MRKGLGMDQVGRVLNGIPPHDSLIPPMDSTPFRGWAASSLAGCTHWRVRGSSRDFLGSPQTRCDFNHSS